MEIHVREATVGDYNAVCGLFEEVDALHRNNLPHIFRMPDGAARDHDYYEGLIADANTAFLVAESEEAVLGFVHATVRDAPALPVFVTRRYVIVDGLVVKPGFQSLGIGRMLMDKVQEWAVAVSAASIELNVFEFNKAAISFYERLGYRPLSRKMNKDLSKDSGTYS